ncbi:MAG: VOC family protein [Rhodospirillaceae bacterium]|nr:VOC family protein [Rhodospirillaceae bacterium]
MRIHPYLAFEGRCEDAFRFYQDVLGGTIEVMLSYQGSPMAEHVPPDWGGKIMHACLKLEDQMLMGSDVPPEAQEKPQGFHLSLQIADVPAAERVFHALSQGGTVRMPLQETFWALRFGMLVDRFGIPWMVNCSRPE